MFANRTPLFAVAAAVGLAGVTLASRCVAAEPERARPAVLLAADRHGEDEHEGHAKAEKGEKHEAAEKSAEKADEVEQSVPVNMVPQPVIDAVMKECPGGKITEAELEAKKGKILWTFDVTVGEAKYDVKITTDGKFHSKKAEADQGEKHDEKK